VDAHAEVADDSIGILQEIDGLAVDHAWGMYRSWMRFRCWGGVVDSSFAEGSLRGLGRVRYSGVP
ncbi:MAG TPA: hypothetical protein VGU23_02735, partial [Acidobacteriaceae bacterium]|nr:hypothetical protein [Acidobacteriaceae bacterium]